MVAIRNKKKRIIFIVLFFALIALASIMIIYVSRTKQKSDIFFRTENSAAHLEDIITKAVEMTKERWGMSEDSVIAFELIHGNEQGRIELIYIRLMDTDHMCYDITATTSRVDAVEISVSVCRKGRSKGEANAIESMLQQGIPLTKNQVFLEYLQTEYDWKNSFLIQYMGRSMDNSEIEAAGTEKIYFDGSRDSGYYCFAIHDCFEGDKGGTGGKNFYLPIE